MAELNGSCEDLEKLLETKIESAPREAAEIAYALSRIHLSEKNHEKAREFGEKSLELFDKCKMDSLEDCASRHTVISGIVIPDIIHQDVVKNRLAILEL